MENAVGLEHFAGRCGSRVYSSPRSPDVPPTKSSAGSNPNSLANGHSTYKIHSRELGATKHEVVGGV